jgi:DNA-binding MarR family transcriptional regulator
VSISPLPTRTVYLLRVVTLTMRVEIDRRLHPFGLTAIQYTILSILARREGLSSAELARRFLVTPQTMNTMILSLERKGLVARQTNAANRRILRASLTRKGVTILGKCDALIDELEAELAASVGPAQLKSFRAALKRVGTHFPRERTSRRNGDAAQVEAMLGAGPEA